MKKYNIIKGILLAAAAICTLEMGQMRSYAQTGAEDSFTSAELNSMYGIGSTSKVIAAAAVMKLSGEGRIDLDAPLVTYIPEFNMADARYVEITPRMLLDHTSGLPGGTLSQAMLLGDNDTYNHDMLLELLKGQRLKAEPGEFGVYCNDGFTLAEILVERVSGMTFTEYLDKEFASPLGLTQIKTPQSKDAAAHLASIYDSNSGKELPYEAANVIGSGGIYAAASDLVTLSQIFMRKQGDAQGILPEELAKEMEYSRFSKEYNPDGNDTNISFGLGWDSVDAYPFNRYGIKALVKGGDTSYYHSSLTVLPEENISCAVLTSGGSGMFNQLAVQEILLTYLEEIGRIEREDESGTPLTEPLNQVPEDLLDYGGVYSGADLFNLAISGQGELTLSGKSGGHEKNQTYQYGGDGRFYSTEGNYVNFKGELTRGSNGRTGKTALEFMTADNGRRYLMAQIYEFYPSLGRVASYLPVAELIEPKTPVKAVTDAWREWCGKEYYLVSEKYTSAMYMMQYRLKPLLSTEIDGYLTFEDMDLKMAKLSDGTHAEFFQKVPGQAGRDLNDFRIEEKSGNTYLISNSSRYVSIEDLEELPGGDEKIIIDKNGEAVWFLCGNVSRRISIETPANGAWYVYDHTGREMRCISSSWTLEKGQQFLLPEGGRIVFAGDPGAVFAIHYTE